MLLDLLSIWEKSATVVAAVKVTGQPPVSEPLRVTAVKVVQVQTRVGP